MGSCTRFADDRYFIATSYYNKKDSSLGFIFHYFDDNGTLLKEDSIGLMKRSETLSRLEIAKIVLNDDNTYSIITYIKNKQLNDSSYLCIVNLNNKQWVTNYSLFGPKYNLLINDAIAYPNNQICVLTSFASPGLIKTTNKLLIYNRSSKTISENVYDKYDNVSMTNIIASKSGNLYTSGRKWDLAKQKYSFYTAKLKNNFDIDWDLFWGEDSNEKSIHKLIIDEDNSIISAFGVNNYQSYIAKIGIQTDIKEKISEINFISPNPAIDFVEIQNPENKVIEIVNVFGQNCDLTPTLSIHGEGARFDVSTLAPGMYFVKIGDKVSKFVKL